MEPRKPPREDQYLTILDSIADGVFTVDLDFQITSFNRAAEEITGFSRNTAIGQACSDVFKADVCSDACILKQALKEQKAIVHRPVYIIRTDKKRIPISVNATLLRNKAGHVIGGVETFRDLTSVQKLRKALRKQHSFNDIVSKNEKMNKIFSILPRIAESNSTVLIGGQSGTGKELIARAIHNHSPQKDGPFVTVNCGALPDTLCESELFGYKAGAFTDAKRDKLGRFALAQNGSIFLDEIGDISPAVQIRLLRVLENRVYEPLGSTKTIETNARVIAATHRNLGELVKQGTFREDLYFRINIIRLSLPTLAERKSDIPLLIDHFIERFNHIHGRNILGSTQEAIAAMLMYPWPGNVRELENAIEHAFALCQEDLIQMAHLPEDVIPENGSIVVTTGLTLKEVEKQTIEQALKRNSWKRVKTARELGINKNTLRYKIERYGINTEK
ncbi:MAG: sigma 54-interacting transcriptional regulator [Desulfobacterales bacterium]|jgi:PAS domain S-box-containing protein